MVSRTRHELEIEVLVRSEVKKQLDRDRRAVDRFGKTTKRSFKEASGATDLLARSMNTARVAVTGFIAASVFVRVIGGLRDAAAAAVELSKSMVEVASAGDETRSAFNFIFGDLADQQEEFVQRTALLLGRFSGDLREVQVNLAGLLGPLGFATEDIAKLANILTQVGIDLGSFFNREDAEVFAKLVAGLAGESEPLRILGTDLRQANIEAKAFALGFGESIKELTAQERAIAAVSLILESSNDKLGDALRTIDSFANVVKRIAASFKETQDILGQELIASIQEAVKAAGGVENVLIGIELVLGSIAAAAKFSIDAIDDLTEATARFIVLFPGGSAAANLLGIGGTATDVQDFFARRRLEIAASRLQAQGVAGVEFEIVRLAAVAKALQLEPGPETLDFIRTELVKTFEAAAAEASKGVAENLLAELQSIDPQADTTIVKAVDPAFGIAARFKLQGELVRTFADQLVLQRQINEAERDSLTIAFNKGKLDQEALDTLTAIFDKVAAARIETIEANIEIQDNLRTFTLGKGAVDDLASGMGALAARTREFDQVLDDLARNFIANFVRMQAEALLLRQILFPFFTGPLGLTAGAFNQFFGTSFEFGGVVESAHGNTFGHQRPGISSSPQLVPLASLSERPHAELIAPVRQLPGGEVGLEIVGAGVGGGGIVFQPGAIQIVAAPNQSPEEIARAVMAAIASFPGFKRFMNVPGTL